MDLLKHLIDTEFPWVDDDTARRLRIYFQLLAKWNRSINLTGFPESEWMDRIAAESLLLVDLIPGRRDEEHSGNTGDCSYWMDMGTGAGIPGIIIATALPEQSMILVDSRRKKMDFVEQAVRELGLQNVQPICERLENVCRRRPDLQGGISVIFSRALADIPTLMEYGRPFAAPEAVMIVPVSGRVDKKAVEYPASDQTSVFGHTGIRTVPGSGRQILCTVMKWGKQNKPGRPSFVPGNCQFFLTGWNCLHILPRYVLAIRDSCHCCIIFDHLRSAESVKKHFHWQWLGDVPFHCGVDSPGLHTVYPIPCPGDRHQ